MYIYVFDLNMRKNDITLYSPKNYNNRKFSKEN